MSSDDEDFMSDPMSEDGYEDDSLGILLAPAVIVGRGRRRGAPGKGRVGRVSGWAVGGLDAL